MASPSRQSRAEGRISEKDAEAKRRAWEIEQAWLLLEQASPSVAAMRSEWRNQRSQEQSGRCTYCRQLLTQGELLGPAANQLTLDHVIPLGKGGLDALENAVAACYTCNNVKGMLDLQEFAASPIRKERLAEANAAPDRLSADENSPYYSKLDLDRGVRVFFKGRERFDVHEYSTHEGWVTVPAGKAKNRFGMPILLKLIGKTEPIYQIFLEDLIAEGKLDLSSFQGTKL